MALCASPSLHTFAFSRQLVVVVSGELGFSKGQSGGPAVLLCCALTCGKLMAIWGNNEPLVVLVGLSNCGRQCRKFNLALHHQGEIATGCCAFSREHLTEVPHPRCQCTGTLKFLHWVLAMLAETSFPPRNAFLSHRPRALLHSQTKLSPPPILLPLTFLHPSFLVSALDSMLCPSFCAGR
jgi:hypothetical protein